MKLSLRCRIYEWTQASRNCDTSGYLCT